MMRMRRLRSAQYWLITIPASMVLPKPTSSARITPGVKGVRKANSAASTWWGLGSTWASKSSPASLPT